MERQSQAEVQIKSTAVAPTYPKPNADITEAHLQYLSLMSNHISVRYAAEYHVVLVSNMLPLLSDVCASASHSRVNKGSTISASSNGGRVYMFCFVFVCDISARGAVTDVTVCVNACVQVML